MKFLASICLAAVFADAIHVSQKAEKRPLSPSEKAEVGSALTGALSVLSGKSQGGSKLASCLQLFPNKVQGSESAVLWASCKDELIPKGSLISMATHFQQLNRAGPVSKVSVPVGGEPLYKKVGTFGPINFF